MPVDPDSPEHPYLQLAADLRERIASGQVRSRLPSLTALAAESGLAVSTVRRAVQVLIDEGAVFTVAGRGMFARRPAVPDPKAKQR